MTKKCKAAGASCYSGDTIATITTGDDKRITADVDTPGERAAANLLRAS